MTLAILAAVFTLVLAPAAAQGPIFGTITGPNALAPSQVSAYNLTINGGPSGAVTYTVRWHLNGGGLPSAASPTTTTGNRTTFTLNVTAPPTEGTVTLVVQVASLAGSTYENTTVEKAISIITPIVLSATFRNDGTTAAVNVTVRFYVDGALAGTRKIARLNPGAQVTETFNYLPSGLQPGTHQVRVEADLDGNGIIDPAKGEAVVTSLFYRGTAPLSTAWTVLIGVGVFVPVMLLTIALRRRKRA
ncbi:MAG TPA: CARDB domain-containing protein [Thermoplasmata archaeon]|nr:CARDB domain-containing protein [Thermoplasmata archaeon]